MPADRPRCLAIAGPTASGKSAASLAIAQRWPVEIISVDSALVYRGMDIGTAKPTPAELAQVPHHLIDTLDPLQAYSAAGFVSDATRLIGEIQARGRTPLLVGGTMLYFKALMQGLNQMPRADAAVRQGIEARAAQLGWPALHAELARWYWELAYVGLAQGSVLEHVLQQAWSHVMAALQGNSGGEMYLLAGRIAMEQGNLDEALAQFDQSAQAGMDAVQLAPYRAEIAFLRQRYEEIPEMLATMPAELLQRPPFAALARYWL